MTPGGLQRACCCGGGALFETMLIAFKPTVFTPQFMSVRDGEIAIQDLLPTLWDEDYSPYRTPIVRSPVDGYPTFLYTTGAIDEWEHYVYAAEYGIAGWGYGLVLGVPATWWYSVNSGIGVDDSGLIYFSAHCVNTETKSGLYRSISSPSLIVSGSNPGDISISPLGVAWAVVDGFVLSSGVSESLSGAISCSHLPSGNLVVGCLGKVCERTGAASYTEHSLPVGYTTSSVIVRCDRAGGKHIVLFEDHPIYGYAAPDSWDWEMDADSLYDLGNMNHHRLNINSADHPEVVAFLKTGAGELDIGRISIAEKVGSSWQSVTADQDSQAANGDYPIGGAATLPLSW